MAYWTLVVLIAFTAMALGHGTIVFPPVPPSPPFPPVKPNEPGTYGYTVQAVYPERWSWLHWWEANRDPYLRTLRQGRDRQKADQKEVESLKVEAVVTLRRQLLSGAEIERAMAALALGRIGDLSARDDVKRLAGEDRSEAVRRRAAVALEMMGGAPAEGEKLAARKAAARGDGVSRVRSDHPVMASEELLSLGDAKDDASLGLLLDVLAGGPGAMRVPAWARLSHLHAMKNAMIFAAMQRAAQAAQDIKTYKTRLAQFEKEAAALPEKWRGLRDDALKMQEQYRKEVADFNRQNPGFRVKPREFDPLPQRPPAPIDRAKKAGVTFASVTIGEEKIGMAKLQASAAIALGRSDRKEAVAGLIELLRTHDDGYNVLPKGFAIMSLGEMSLRSWPPEVTRAIAATLADVMDKSERDSPLRGYAALALGLYVRTMETEQGPVDPPGFEKILEGLAGRLADPRETEEVRAASALALGLSSRTSSLKPLRVVASELTERDEVIGGYLLLARGMLGDSTLAPIVGKFLAIENDRSDMSAILSRRAAALGVGLAGTDDAVPVLTQAWHLNYYVNREVILALAVHGARALGAS